MSGREGTSGSGVSLAGCARGGWLLRDEGGYDGYVYAWYREVQAATEEIPSSEAENAAQTEQISRIHPDNTRSPSSPLQYP